MKRRIITWSNQLTSAKKQLTWAWLPMFVWLGVIFFESTSVFTSEHTAGWIHRVLTLLPVHLTAAQLQVVNAVLRKVGHFVGYATLSWFAFRGWMETLAYRRNQFLQGLGRPVETKRRWHLRPAVLAILCTIAVAALDEFHQAHIPGRTGIFYDVVLDTFGGIFAQIVLLLYWTRRDKGKPRGDVTIPVEHAVAD